MAEKQTQYNVTSLADIYTLQKMTGDILCNIKVSSLSQHTFSEQYLK